MLCVRRGGVHVLAVVLGTAILSAGSAVTALSQERLPLLQVDVDLGDYGIASVAEVRRGQVAVAYAPDGPGLNVYFLRDTPAGSRVTPPEPPPTPEPVEGGDVTTDHTALWVWNTEELIADPAERAAFLDFIQAQGITRVFLYLAAETGTRPEAGYIPFSSAEIGPLLAELRERGALAYALDGDRDYVLEENHAGVFRTVERLLEHNRSVPAEQRFHGVRYDIEPYLAAGFQGPARQSLLNGYVTLIAGVARIAEGGDLAVAVDVPFWFDAPNEETGEIMEAELHGERAPILEHVMSLVDDIAIMDYRTDAHGPNGVLAHAYHELELGERKGVDVFVGVETIELIDEDLHTFFGPTREGLPPAGPVRWVVLEDPPHGGARLWLADGEYAIAQLATRVDDAAILRHWPAGRPARIAGDAQSFYNLGAERMKAVTADVIRRLADRPAFVGLAFHDYRGLQELLRR